MSAQPPPSTFARAVREVDPLPFADGSGLHLIARRVLEARRRLGALSPGDLLRDTAWDMMLELFIALQTGRRLCVKDLTLLCGESPAGAVRRIDRLQAAGLVGRKVDRQDHRRVFVELSDRGFEAMRAMLEDLAMATK